MAKSLIHEVVAASPNRRSFLKTISAATAGVTAMSVTGLRNAEAQTTTEMEVLQFALNLEYLEAEFYTYGLYGRGIESFGIGVHGTANGANPAEGGQTKGGTKVGFTQASEINSYEILDQVGTDERSHVKLLREALGSQAIAKPNLNLNALGIGFHNQQEFVTVSRIFEDIGVSAYGGAAGMLTTPSIITTASRILATEAEHVAAARVQLAYFKWASPVLDGADLVPPPPGAAGQILSVNRANGLPAIRTPGQVLYLAYGNQANATSGGFFPSGVNGKLTSSSAPATAANLL